MLLLLSKCVFVLVCIMGVFGDASTQKKSKEDTETVVDEGWKWLEGVGEAASELINSATGKTCELLGDGTCYQISVGWQELEAHLANLGSDVAQRAHELWAEFEDEKGEVSTQDARMILQKAQKEVSDTKARSGSR